MKSDRRRADGRMIGWRRQKMPSAGPFRLAAAAIRLLQRPKIQFQLPAARLGSSPSGRRTAALRPPRHDYCLFSPARCRPAEGHSRRQVRSTRSTHSTSCLVPAGALFCPARQLVGPRAPRRAAVGELVGWSAAASSAGVVLICISRELARRCRRRPRVLHCRPPQTTFTHASRRLMQHASSPPSFPLLFRPQFVLQART